MVPADTKQRQQPMKVGDEGGERLPLYETPGRPLYGGWGLLEEGGWEIGGPGVSVLLLQIGGEKSQLSLLPRENLTLMAV